MRVPISLSNRYVRDFFILLTLVGAGLVSVSGTFELYELQTYDWRCQFRAARPISDDIVIVEIGDDALKRLGWPLDRKYHAEIIRYLKQCGAKAIALDLIIPDLLPVSDPATKIHPSDVEFLDAMKKAGNVYLGFSFPKISLASKKKPVAQIPRRELRQIAFPYWRYMRAAKGIGYINTIVDMDGKRRRIVPTVFYNKGNYYQLSLKVAKDILGVPPGEAIFKPGKYLQLSPTHKIPLNEDSSMIVNYARLWKEGYTHYSYSDLVDSYQKSQRGEKPRIDPAKLKGKICFVGLTATALHDINPTPLESVYPMMGQYVNVLNSILQNDYIRRLDKIWNFLIVSYGALLLGLLTVRLRPLQGLWMTMSWIFLYTFVAIILFVHYGLWIDLFYPILIFSATYTICTVGRVMTEMRKRQLMETELKIASQIQNSFLPEKPPSQEGLSLSVFMKPAKQVGGDVYEFVPLPEQKLGVMVGDVTGKGTPAALYMAKTVSEFKLIARDNPDPADVLTKLNNSIASGSRSGLFVTLCYVIFDLKNKKLMMSNGGHLPLVTESGEGQMALLTTEEGLPIGIMEGTTFTKTEFPIKSGDCFALYSDGISEARNLKEEEYGVKTLQKQIDNRHKGTAESILKQTVADVAHFVGKAEQHDDMTLIVIKID